MNPNLIKIDESKLDCIKSALFLQIKTTDEQLALIKKKHPKGKNSEMYQLVEMVRKESIEALKAVGGSTEFFENEMRKLFFGFLSDRN